MANRTLDIGVRVQADVKELDKLIKNLQNFSNEKITLNTSGLEASLERVKEKLQNSLNLGPMRNFAISNFIIPEIKKIEQEIARLATLASKEIKLAVHVERTGEVSTALGAATPRINEKINWLNQGIGMGTTFAGFPEQMQKAQLAAENLQRILNKKFRGFITKEEQRDLERFKQTLEELGTVSSRTLKDEAIARWGRTLGTHLVTAKDRIDEATRAFGNIQKWLKENEKTAPSALVETVKRLAVETQLLMHGFEKGKVSIRNFAATWSILKTEMKDLMFWQARWYATKFFLFTPIQAGMQALTTGFDFGKVISEWEGKLLRWGATSGKVTDEMKANIKGVILEIRKAAIDSPTAFEDIAKSAEAFIGAGIPEKVIKNIVPQLAQLKTAFPEINTEQFGVAITGVFNAMKDSMKGVKDEGQFIIEITEKLLRAQARGVIRPEQFVQVIQHLGEMSRQAGFTVDEMLSLSVLVTDLGSRAGSAARSLRGMMETLVKDVPQQKLKLLGIEINKDKTLAEQFVPVMRQLREALGEPGAKSAGALKALAAIFPVERVKSVTAAMDFLDKYLALVYDISNAQGGLAESNKAMTQTVSGQLGILNNRWREFAGTIFTSNGVLSKFIKDINDMLLGALLAVGENGLVAERRLKELGDAGKIVYGIFEGLSGAFKVFSGIFQVLYAPIDLLITAIGKLGAAITGTGETIKIISTMITTVLLGALSAKTLAWLGVGKALGSFIAFLQKIPGALSSVSNALALFYTKNLPIFLALAAAAAAMMIIEKQKSKDKEPGYAAQEKSEFIKSKSGTMFKSEFLVQDKEGKWVEDTQAKEESIRNLLISEQNLLGEKEKELELAKEGQEISDDILVSTKVATHTPGQLWSIEEEIKGTKENINVLKQELIAVQSINHEKKKAKDIPDIKTPKQRFSGELSDIKKEYDEQIKVIRDKEKEKNSIISDAFTLQEITRAEADALILDNTIEANDKEIALEKQKWEEIKVAYNKNMGMAKGEQKDAIKADFQNAEKEHQRKLIEIDIQTNEMRRKLVVSSTQEIREILKEHYKLEADLMKIESARQLDILNFQLNQEKKIRDYRYSKKDISATDYYDAELKAAERLRDARLVAAQAAKDAWYKENDLNLKRMNSPEEEGSTLSKIEIEKLKNAKRLVDEALIDESRKSWQDWKDIVLDINIKLAEDIQKIFEQYGIGGVLAKVAKDMSKVYGDMATNIKSSFETVMNSLESSIEGLFDGLMEGTFEWKKAIENVLKTTAKEIFKTFTVKPFMSGLTGKIGEWLKPKEGEQPSWLSKLFGATGATGGPQERTATNTDTMVTLLQSIDNKVGGGQGGIADKAKEVFGIGKTKKSDPLENLENVGMGMETTVDGITNKMEQLTQSTETCFGQLFNYIFNFIKNIGSSVMGLFGGSGGGFGGENMSWMGGWDSSAWNTPDFAGSFAGGGRIGLNKLALIGENGPELFKPETSGTVIPNDRLFGQAPSTTVNVINQTKTPVNAKQNEVKFDGKKFIVDVVLEEITSNYGPLRHAVRGIK